MYSKQVLRFFPISTKHSYPASNNSIEFTKFKKSDDKVDSNITGNFVAGCMNSNRVAWRA